MPRKHDHEFPDEPRPSSIAQPKYMNAYTTQQRSARTYSAMHFYIDQEIGAGAPNWVTAGAMLKKNPLIPVAAIGGFSLATLNLWGVFRHQRSTNRLAIYSKIGLVFGTIATLYGQTYYYERKYRREYGHPWHYCDPQLLKKYNIPEDELMMESYQYKQLQKNNRISARRDPQMRKMSGEEIYEATIPGDDKLELFDEIERKEYEEKLQNRRSR